MNAKGWVRAMTPAEGVCTRVVMEVCEVLFLVGSAWVWQELARRGVNGACQLGLSLLVLLRLSAAVSNVSRPPTEAMSWTWLAGAVFSFVFLYTLYHMGMLISACRR